MEVLTAKENNKYPQMMTKKHSMTAGYKLSKAISSWKEEDEVGLLVELRRNVS
jgi:hypothetical protein